MKNLIFDTNSVFEETVEFFETEELMSYDEAVELASDGTCEDIMNDELNIISEALQELIERYEARYNTVVAYVGFVGRRSSHYGSIGGAGASVGRLIDIGSQELTEAFYGDSFDLGITASGTLALNAHDHDGSNYMEMHFLTDYQAERIAGGWGAEEDFLQAMENKNPVKLDKKFKQFFGIK